MLSILDVTPAYLRHSLPKTFVGSGLEKVLAIADGKDYMCETDRSHTAITRAMHSAKVHHSAFGCITWSTPSGLTFEHTHLYFARVSEKQLVSLWGSRFDRCPAGWNMLVDRGFAGTAHYYPKYHVQLSPAFIRGRTQFHRSEAQSDYQICKRRYSCEVVFSRVNQETCLMDIIPREFFTIVQPAHHWGHAAANLLQPLQSN